MFSTIHNEQDQLSKQILNAASELYLKYGFKKVTMDDISKTIGKSRTSIYYYYKNREEVFQAVLSSLVQEVAAEIGNAMDEQKTIEEKIRAFCLTKITTSESKKPFFTAVEAGMNAEEKSRHSRVMEVVHQHLMDGEKIILTKALSESSSKKEIRLLTQEEQDTVIFILQSSIRGIKREMILKNSFDDLNTTVDVLTSMTIKWLE
ncbi:TetR/AcrR family transcriptional regulator [Chryseobacterium lactis]|uniref:TetR/AcrR family transcriptional regulator n=1 Tax=Chryseobacterium lactis TaxID=1241981 RepID=A0A3G6RSF3_CHRLC|nr:TetR/AcrR family transcriptional regulator [Chryseobacterium lactis]AZA84408.1 TetR/AcrR family transcriptional regulator [Chryseobacterium lactis]AZB04796.1 TetR/AcrR family transcriptional regulator [Chryseobacterium lactis]PNW14527.1 TetR/AcrR family transcriptional regulator [Chryseobacterium lactis]